MMDVISPNFLKFFMLIANIAKVETTRQHAIKFLFRKACKRGKDLACHVGRLADISGAMRVCPHLSFFFSFPLRKENYTKLVLVMKK